MTKPPIFNNYNEDGFRVTINGHRSSRIADETIVYNLRFKWQVELAEVSDAELVNIYDEFAMTEGFGNNDEGFLPFLKEYLS